MIPEATSRQELKANVEKMLGDLGSGRGLNVDACNDISAALRELAHHYQGRDSVPRDMVLHVYGLVGAMLGIVDRYGPVEGPKIANKAAELDELILACFSDD